MLSFKKINTTQAKTGFEVVQMLKGGRRFDAILIDNQLPIMSGIETIQHILEKKYNNNFEQHIIPVFSAYEHNIAQLCQPLDITCWLVKPVTQEALYAALVKSIFPRVD